MSGFCGRLAPTQDPYFRGDAETGTLFCIPESGATWPLVNALGVVVDVPFLSGPTSRSASYEVSGLGAGKIFDVWATEVSGLAVLGLAEWTKNYGAGLYGAAGYGGLAPQVSDVPYYGIPVNSTATTLRLSDGSSLSVSQYRATFLGSIRVADSGGLINCHTSYGEAREWGIWNRHNQKPILLKGGATRPFDPSLAVYENQYSPSWAPFVGNLNAHVKVFSGRPVSVDTWYHANAWLQEYAGHSSIIQGAIGWNSTSAPSGVWWQRDNEGYTGTGYIAGTTNCAARYVQPLSVGANKIYPLIKTQNISASSVINDGTSVAEMWGEELRMMLTAEWLG